MNVRVETDDGKQISYWGISDLQVGQDILILHLPYSASLDQITDEARIVSAVDTSTLNQRGTMESIGIDADRDDEVHLFESDEFQHAWVLDEYEMPDDSKIEVHHQ